MSDKLSIAPGSITMDQVKDILDLRRSGFNSLSDDMIRSMSEETASTLIKVNLDKLRMRGGRK